ncbi:MAG: hypothetical protein KAW56_09745 [Candidatus Marinimicrobia bacterium]|nr:hypothetical protein [Candidatus Neomarinimicrobiota bacterium]
MNDKKSRIIARALILYFNEIDSLIADKRYKRCSERGTDTYNLKEVKKEMVIFMDFIIFSFLFCSGEISLSIKHSFP